jgi:tetratricopeptide (TPR) repeat protein
LSQAYAATYKMKESIQELRKCIETDPTYLNAFADLAVHLRDTEEGLDIVEKFIILEGDEGTRGLRLKAWILSTKKQFVEALEVYEEVIDKDPNDPIAYMDSALLLCEIHRYNDAIALAHRAFELHPNNREILHTLAVVLERMGRNDEAVVIFNKLLKLYPGNQHVLFFFGQLLVKMGRTKEILAHIADATEKFPEKESDYQSLLEHFRKETKE